MIEIDNKSMECQCDLCTNIKPRVERLKKNLSEEDFADVMYFVNRLICVEEDAEYWELKAKGKWTYEKS